MSGVLDLRIFFDPYASEERRDSSDLWPRNTSSISFISGLPLGPGLEDHPPIHG